MRLPPPAVAWAMLLPLGIAGCSGGSAGQPGQPPGEVIRAMADVYGAFLLEHKNLPPKTEEEFRQFLGGKADLLAERKLTVDKMFVSPRNDKPFQWVVGRKPPAGPMGMTFIGYEAEPTDGERLVVATRGMHEVMSDAKFQSLFGKPNK